MPLQAAIADLHVFKQHHLKQQRVAGLLERPAPLQQRCIQRKAHHPHHQGGEHGALAHQAIKHRFLRRPGPLAQHIALGRFKGEGDILHTIGGQIQPEQLHRQQRQG